MANKAHIDGKKWRKDWDKRRERTTQAHTYTHMITYEIKNWMHSSLTSSGSEVPSGTEHSPSISMGISVTEEGAEDSSAFSSAVSPIFLPVSSFIVPSSTSSGLIDSRKLSLYLQAVSSMEAVNPGSTLMSSSILTSSSVSISSFTSTPVLLLLLPLLLLIAPLLSLILLPQLLLSLMVFRLLRAMVSLWIPTRSPLSFTIISTLSIPLPLTLLLSFLTCWNLRTWHAIPACVTCATLLTKMSSLRGIWSWRKLLNTLRQFAVWKTSSHITSERELDSTLSPTPSILSLSSSFCCVKMAVLCSSLEIKLKPLGTVFSALGTISRTVDGTEGREEEEEEEEVLRKILSHEGIDSKNSSNGDCSSVHERSSSSVLTLDILVCSTCSCSVSSWSKYCNTEAFASPLIRFKSAVKSFL